jgi:hypothetical protein
MARKKKTLIKKSEDTLLEVAKGVSSPETILEKKYWDDLKENRKDFINYRREARRAVYKILKNQNLKRELTDPELIEMYNIINPQLDPNKGLRWNGFTKVWDLHPNNVKKIILKEHWIKEGGGFDLDFGSHYPTAFTEQKLE